MQRDDDSGEVLDGVAGMHPAVDRLRHLLASATFLDLKATADGYWTHPPGTGSHGSSRPPEGGR
jgi:hypothetical protein